MSTNPTSLLNASVPWPFPKRVGTVGQFLAMLRSLQTMSYTPAPPPLSKRATPLQVFDSQQK